MDQTFGKTVHSVVLLAIGFAGILDFYQIRVHRCLRQPPLERCILSF